MGWKTFLTGLLMVLAIPVLTRADTGMGSVVDVRIVSDSGGEFAQYRAYPRGSQDGNYFYVEAVKEDRYSIRVTNKSHRRIGVVVAVDGRNIISGEESNLKRNERMYIIGPYETNIFEGWRTGMDRTNRFYFSPNSPTLMRKRSLPMPQPWARLPFQCIGKESLRSLPTPRRRTECRRLLWEHCLLLPMRAVLPIDLKKRRTNRQAPDSAKRPIPLLMSSNLIQSTYRLKRSF